MPRKKSGERQPKPLNEMFSEDWKQGVKKLIADKKNSSDDWQRSFADLSEAAIARKILGDVALAYATDEMFGRIITDAEKVCNEIGISLIQDGATVERCVTKTHKECTAKYVGSDPAFKRTIICKCACHSKGKRRAQTQ